MYVPGQERLAFSAEPDAGCFNHCWCNRTMTEVGLDDDLVTPGGCSSATRSCYEAI